GARAHYGRKRVITLKEGNNEGNNYMNRIVQSIKNRLSLRPPQADSLNILAELTDRLTLKKHTPDPSLEGNTLSSELEIVKSAYPTCTDFCSGNKRCYLS
ncbi:MAG: hypothetical protein HW406_2923, partial [Candidatus Brocadiaceae bacterium]|nr:hypothetical protein [Candidatus Brocadiaceae bacterium]